MQEFPGNSAKAKAKPKPAAEAPPLEDRPKIERVTSAEVQQRKRGLGRRFKETFIGGSAKDTIDHMFVDIVIPAVQDTLLDALQSGFERLIKGESASSTRRSPTSSSNGYTNLGRFNYSGLSKPSTTAQAQASPRALSRRSRSTHDFGEIIIDTRREAQNVIDDMYELLSRLGEVSVADLYTMTGIDSTHVDMRWGWTSLKGLRAVRIRDGRYVLDLPEPTPLD